MADTKDGSSANLSEAEYIALLNQKADDWRWISGVNPALLGVAGALFAAGVAQQQAIVVAFSPGPLFLGVWHMVRHARIQQPMLTYLSNYAPDGNAHWQRDFEEFLSDIARQRLEDGKPKRNLAVWWDRLRQKSAWNIWLVISLVVAVGANLVPLVAGHDAHYHQRGLALAVAVLVAVGFSLIILWQAAQIDSDKEIWNQRWRDKRANAAESQ